MLAVLVSTICVTCRLKVDTTPTIFTIELLSVPVLATGDETEKASLFV